VDPSDLSCIKPETVASALSPESQEDAIVLIAEVRTWLEEFEGALGKGNSLRAV
jgi:hypothetical protein